MYFYTISLSKRKAFKQSEQSKSQKPTDFPSHPILQKEFVPNDDADREQKYTLSSGEEIVVSFPENMSTPEGKFIEELINSQNQQK